MKPVLDQLQSARLEGLEELALLTKKTEDNVHLVKTLNELKEKLQLKNGRANEAVSVLQQGNLESARSILGSQDNYQDSLIIETLMNKVRQTESDFLQERRTKWEKSLKQSDRSVWFLFGLILVFLIAAYFVIRKELAIRTHLANTAASALAEAKRPTVSNRASWPA